MFAWSVHIHRDATDDPHHSLTVPPDSAANLGGLPHRRGIVELTRVELVTS